MESFYLTPQYELFVEAKRLFIVDVLAKKPWNTDVIDRPEVKDMINFFTNSFSYHETPYGTAPAHQQFTHNERLTYNLDYAVRRLILAQRALAWTSQSNTYSGRFVESLAELFVSKKERMQRRLQPAAGFSGVSVWHFLMNAPVEVLGVLCNMRFIVPVSPSSWKVLLAESSTPMEEAILLGDLYDEGFIWPDIPCTFVPTSPSGSSSRVVTICPGTIEILNGKEEITRQDAVYNLMRELFGHHCSEEFKLHLDCDRFLYSCHEAAVRLFGSLDKLPRDHVLSVMQKLINDARCSSRYFGSIAHARVTFVSLIEFLDTIRRDNYFNHTPVEGNDQEVWAMVDAIVSPQRDLFQQLHHDFPSFS